MSVGSKRFPFTAAKLCAALSLTCVLSAAPVHAAVPSSKAKVFSVKDPNALIDTVISGKAVACFRSKSGRVYAGKPNGARTKFRADNSKAALDAIKAKISRASGAARKKLQKQLKAKKEFFAARTAGCRAIFSGNPNPQLPPGATPTPSAEMISLEPYTAALGIPEIQYLLEKAGYGGALGGYGAFIGQGVDALVNEFVRSKAEDPNFELEVDNWTDNNLTTRNEVPPPAPTPFMSNRFVPSRDGVRRSLLYWTLGSVNPFRMRLMHMLLKVFSVNACLLSENGSTLRPSTNQNTPPRQAFLYWQYLKLIAGGAKYPNLPSLVRNIAQDAAVLIAHRNAGSLKDSPSELFAQELLDRFTIGAATIDAAGNRSPTYSRNLVSGSTRSDDLARVARRLTGWSIGVVDSAEAPNGLADYIQTGQISSVDHSPGPETIFEGTAYAFPADTDSQLISGLFQNHPAAGENWARILLAEFVTPNPPLQLVQALAAEIKAANFNLEEPLKKLLKSRAFFYAGYRNTVAKSPLDLTIESIKTLNLTSLMMQQAELTQLDSWLRNSASAFNAGSRGLGYDMICAPSVHNLLPQKFGTAGNLAAEVQIIGRLIQRGLNHVNGSTQPKVWTEDMVLPLGQMSYAQLVDYLKPNLGVDVTPDQLSKLEDMMSYINSGSNVRLQPYTNLDVGSDLISGRRGKGMTLVLFMMSLPGFMFR